MEFQLKMEHAALGTSLEGDVRKALEERSGWLSRPLPRLPVARKKKKSKKSKTGKAKAALVRPNMLNLRSPCPRGCHKRKAPLPKGPDRKDYPILRKSCKQRPLLVQLIRLEQERREAETAFWTDCASKPCCGTMDDCPLREVT
jgi:hypothetical protein